jgi:hypothetical protein
MAGMTDISSEVIPENPKPFPYHAPAWHHARFVSSVTMGYYVNTVMKNIKGNKKPAFLLPGISINPRIPHV